MRIVILASAILLSLLPAARSIIRVLDAINCGGPEYTDSNGVTYDADTNTDGARYAWNLMFGGITGPDALLYATCRYTSQGTPVTYRLPVAGNGQYALVLHFADDSSILGHRIFNVKLNGNIQVLTNFDIYDECGHQNICNQIVYFSICEGVLYWTRNGDSGTSSVVNGTVSVSFDQVTTNAVIGGIMLVSGNTGDSKTVVSNRDIIYFDPVKERRCMVPKAEVRRRR
jgi:Malectin domain